MVWINLMIFFKILSKPWKLKLKKIFGKLFTELSDFRWNSSQKIKWFNENKNFFENIF